MNLQEYYRRNAKLLYDEKAYLEKLFLETVFYTEYGDKGLDYLEYQKRIYDPNYRRFYFIDFVIEYNNRKYAIELDGYSIHGQLTPEEFEYQEIRSNEISHHGYVLFRYTYDRIKNHPDEVRADLKRNLPLLSVQNQPKVPVPPPNPVPAPSTKESSHVVSQPPINRPQKTPQTDTEIQLFG